MTDRDGRPSGRTVAWWVGIGSLLGLVVAGTLFPFVEARRATDTSFALGVLLFGFGVATWGGAVGFGDSMSAVQSHLGGESAWSREGARQAFAVLTWVGAGWAGTAVGASILLVGV
ncbi:hypothetical protein PM076_15915 [Halorubrum ezzemoulense]|uniref:Uncharacterized protein n=2 Tax=Halorubrum ezzemoulense TaxID=337243 RepID=A0A256J5S8_HALEZ|nr:MULTISPECIES: hypothetical protein [Halorubrum]MDB2225850.1 hypothetical protein [Halorubrum ezzemoulense]MDB2239347.1 hypothetical protein [Halorubrum ezzemoulense]MDB2242760.1 hypothetical protein [Halorubrum ezzemoulense]MDB2246213.1 hypothetical protein [Halorubrum ezzemoulense]MDB2249307.1 hypothetical protein [Halorubrum ezzemoulense]